MSNTQKAYLQLHICILLWGLTAILGKMISLSGLVLVWWRILFTVVSLLLMPAVFPDLKKLNRVEIKRMASVGIFIMLHWVCFYSSIKYSNASITLSCLATTSICTALIEPLWNKTPFKWYEIALGFGIVPCMALMYGLMPSTYYFGIFLGLGSALFAAIFTTLNKQLMDNITISPVTVSFTELFFGFLGVSVLMPIYLYLSGDAFMPSMTAKWFGLNDYGWLIILSLACTTLPFILSLKSLKHLSAFSTTLAVNLEPVYGIILAWLVFEENKELNTNFYIGIVFVLFIVALHPVLKNKFEK